MTDALGEAQEAYATFLDGFRSVVLATVDAAGRPTASYAPCIVDERQDAYVLVSGLAEHTANLEATRQASALFVEDEGAAAQIFARRRLTYACDAEVVPRASSEFAAVSARFATRFGKMAEHILSMPDFRLVRLRPRSGRFVLGFGAAYAIEDDDLSRLIPLRGEGQGHGGHGGRAAGLTPEVVARIAGHMNADHADALLVLARVQGRTGEAEAALLEDLDAHGLDLRVTVRGEDRPLRVPFPRPVASAAEVREVLMRMTQEAREASPPP